MSKTKPPRGRAPKTASLSEVEEAADRFTKAQLEELNAPEVIDQGSVGVSSHEELGTFVSGKEMNPVKARPGADPLLVKSLELFRKLMAGQVLAPWATLAFDEVGSIIKELKEAVA